MADKTGIEWTDATWNPVTGCTEVSPGCDHCYAKTFAERWRGTPHHYFENGFDVQLRPERLTQPLRWRRPRRIFVNSMSDLFHDQVPDDYIAHVFAVMQSCAAHTFQVLTKRHGRMRSLLNSDGFWEAVTDFGVHVMRQRPSRSQLWPDHGQKHGYLPNVWLGVSAENQQWANIRIPALLDTPAAVRFVSAEPLIGPIDLATTAQPNVGGVPKLDWVIVGGESGRGARPMHLDWVRTLRDQCVDADVAFLFKQHGEWLGQASRIDFPRDPDAWVNRETGEVADARTALRDGGSWLGVWRAGKKAAGRELDGQTWDQYPQEMSI